MNPLVIKFVSFDGLVAYQLWDQRRHAPEHILSRFGQPTVFTTAMEFKTIDEIPISSRAVRRQYRLYDRYADQQNGNIVWEYREIL